MSLTALHTPFSTRNGVADGPVLTAWIRGGDGRPAPVYGHKTGHFRLGLAADAPEVHLRVTAHDRRSKRADEPLRLPLRDVHISGGLHRVFLRQYAPEAVAILDAYGAGQIRGREKLIAADRAFRGHLKAALRKFAVQGEADSLYLHLATIRTLQRIIQYTYTEPTDLSNALPRTILGTEFDTFRVVIEQDQGSIARLGGRDPQSAPLSSFKRDEKLYTIIPIDAGAKVHGWEIRQAREAAANAPDAPEMDLFARRGSIAEGAVKRMASMIGMFGIDSIPGVLGKEALTKVPRAEYDFIDADPKVVVAAINTAIRDQFTAVGEEPLRACDSIMMAPARFMYMSQTHYDVQDPRNLIDVIMADNPQIKGVYQARECKFNATTQTALAASQRVSAEDAKRMAGGIDYPGQGANDPNRECMVLFRKDADCVEMIVGYDTRVIQYPEHYEEQLMQVAESSGGVIFHEPLTARILRAPAA